jgi:molecular chaperone DnaK
MSRITVDFGIDLGTTNSKIAIIRENEPRIIKNAVNEDVTPSVVYVHPRGEIYVGQEAKKRWMVDPKNTQAWFKRVMGRPMQFSFQNGRTMNPEELSAEVLKSLKSDVNQRLGEDMRAAVITVPAMFPQEACAATQRAAKMAGIDFAPLVMEPVASAMAYGLQFSTSEGFFLVYDLGGGTFDTSLMKVEADRINVIDHGGDNQLGGTDFDKMIVNQIVIPKLEEKFDLAGVSWGETDREYGTPYRKLLYQVEQQKILLSTKPKVTLDILELCRDRSGNNVDVDIDITQVEYEELLKPFVVKTIRLCKDLLERNGLGAGDVNKLLLVGGPTNTPLIRRMLKEDLGIELEFKIDPLAVVAQGAAVFAATQKIPSSVGKSEKPLSKGCYRLDLDYSPITKETETSVGGKVSDQKGQPPKNGFSIELSRGDQGWRSGKIPLALNGAFLTTVKLQSTIKANEFCVELKDPTGLKVDVVPDNFKIIIGLAPGQIAIAARSYGIALVNNKPYVYIKKDTPLPYKTKPGVHKTTTAVRRGESKDLIVIPIIEGEDSRADRNRCLQELKIHGDKIRLDLPKGSEVEVSMEMNESRLLKVRAYVPILDEEFNATVEPYAKIKTADEIAGILRGEMDRIGKIEKENLELNDQDVVKELAEIRSEGLITELEQNITLAGRGDKDALAQIQDRILDLQSRIDRVENFLEWPNRVKDARNALTETQKVVTQYGDASEKNRLNDLRAEVESAISAKNTSQLEQRVSDVWAMYWSVLQKQPGFWAEMYKQARAGAGNSTDPAAARNLVVQGDMALRQGDEQTLRQVTIMLFRLSSQPTAVGGYLSTLE